MLAWLSCLELGADLHIAQLMPLPLTVSCFRKIQIGFTFLVPAHLGSPGKRAVKRVCVCVVLLCFLSWPSTISIQHWQSCAITAGSCTLRIGCCMLEMSVGISSSFQCQIPFLIQVPHKTRGTPNLAFIGNGVKGCGLWV